MKYPFPKQEQKIAAVAETKRNPTTEEGRRVQLPLFKDPTILPTGKYHISFSEVSDWIDCRYRHKLKHIDKIPPPVPDSNIFSVYGKIMHSAMENYLQTKILPKAKDVENEFCVMLKSSLNEEQLEKIKDKIPEFVSAIEDSLNQIEPWLLEAFGTRWQLVATEYPLFESIEKQTNIKFKGFLDTIIKVRREPTKKLLLQCEKEGRLPPVEYDYYIIDLKTCSWGWPANKKRDFKTQMQLILYKHYFCKLMNLDLKDAKCAFVLMKRIPAKQRRPLDRFELVPISVGPKAVERALNTVESMLNQVRKGFVFKNRMACEPFCPYRGTKFCT